MSELDALQSCKKGAGETRNIAIDYRGKLDSGELLTGTPTVAGSPTGLTITNVAVNTSTLTVNGESCLAGQAVQFTVAGGSAGKTYVITSKCGTTATPAQLAVEGWCKLDVV